MATRVRKGKVRPLLEASIQNLEVTIVGPGRVGQSVGKLLAEAGIRVRYVAARRREAARP